MSEDERDELPEEQERRLEWEGLVEWHEKRGPYATDMTTDRDTGEWTLHGLIPKVIFTYDADSGIWELRGFGGELEAYGIGPSFLEAVEAFRRHAWGDIGVPS